LQTDRLSVPVRLSCAENVRASRQPVVLGVPFPKGALANPGQAVLQLGEQTIPVPQTDVLARWADGSARWLLAEMLLPNKELSDATGTLHVHSSATSPPEHEQLGCRVDETANAFHVETGGVRFAVDRRVLCPLAVSPAAETAGMAPLESDTILRDRRFWQRRPLVQTSEVESRGPLRTTIGLAGRFDGCRHLEFRVRICFFAGTGLIRLRVCLHNARRAQHRGGLWDLGDPGSFLFRSLELAFGWAADQSEPVPQWQLEPGAEWEDAAAGEPVEIYQDSSGGENWRSRNHANAHGRVPCRFRGYRLQTAESCQSSLRASPVVRLRGCSGTLTLSIPEFWQQFPKALRIENGSIHAGLFPDRWGDLFELQGGERKTHTLWLHFAGPEAQPDDLAWTHAPARLLCAPQWYAASEVTPYLTAQSEHADERFDNYMRAALAGPESLFAKREVIDQYGWRNYGDAWGDHEQAYYEGPAPVISHYNNQFDMICGSILQTMRTGDPRWIDFFGPLARHVMDIDIYHTEQDRAAYNGGLFWFTDHYHDASTCTHRTFSRFNAPHSGPYGGGPGSEHNFATGLLLYYYLTGDPDARDAVLGLADWVLAMDDGRRTVLAAADSAPTGLASLCGDPDYHGPGRGAANSIQVLLDAWQLSGGRKYLAKAEVLVRRSIHPEDEIAARDLLNVEGRWSYTMFLAALDRYLHVKAEAGSLDRMYAYARWSLVRYACWMVEHERPYFDYPEQLQYPTEAWAAQELRKANVLRMAACYAEPETAEAMRRRGDELAGRAWSDLLRFPTRHYTRAVAIMMIEGLADVALRHAPPAPVPEPEESYTFPPPEEFVPQRRRVEQKLRSASGMKELAGRLARPSAWKQVIRSARRRRGNLR